MDQKKIFDFKNKLTDERLNNHNSHQNELKRLYREIISDMAADYSEYKTYIPELLSSLEDNNTNSVPYSVQLFFELYKKLLGTKQFSFFDLSIMDLEPNQDTYDKMEPIFNASNEQKKEQRLSKDNFDISTLTDDDKSRMVTLIIKKMQHDSKQIDWNEDLVFSNIFLAGFLRQVLRSINYPELFYHSIGLVTDRLATSEYYQPGRDFAEEIILSSYIDGIPELGYLNSFRTYSHTGSIHAALIYANLSLTCILNKKAPYSERTVREFVSQGLRFFRNVKLYHFAKQIYAEVPIELSIPEYERRSLDHSYFSILLLMTDPSLPTQLLDYLRQEREKILTGGEHDAMPWLVTLYNIKRLYPNADFSPSGFGFFLTTFEMIVPLDTVKKYKDVIEGQSEDLKIYLKESLVKLNDTRNTADFVYDNKNAIMLSNRLINSSTIKKDAAAFLLSMTLKADYSILFQEKENKELMPLILPEINVNELNTLYDDTDEFLKKLSLNTNTSMIWLALSEQNLYQLGLHNNVFSFFPLEEWDYNTYKTLLNEDYFADLQFKDTENGFGGVRQISPEEYADEERTLKEKLYIGKLCIDNNADEVYIVKDMELSRYPHNLFLNNAGDLIAKHIPVTNVLSTEWLLQTDKKSQLPSDYKKSIWIPVESEDIPLNYLYSNIEDTLQEYDFKIHEGVELKLPLSADINIVCSHGLNNISETQIISQVDHKTYNLNTIIGKGKILIFFVCHSGSMKAEFFRNNVTSLVKRFIAQGYESVIAPYWALDVTVPRYWLPEFLKSFGEGLPISKAVFNANMKVYERYPTPAAWACLHLYGNPYLTKDMTE